MVKNGHNGDTVQVISLLLSIAMSYQFKSDNCTVFAPPQYMRPFIGKDGCAKSDEFSGKCKRVGGHF